MADRRGTSEEIDCRIVYVGPSGGGKSTTVRAVHERLETGTRSALLAPARADGGTPLTDLLTVDLGMLAGRNLRLQLLTAPGEIRRAAVRGRVLSGADGLIFVADSAPDRLEANKDALAAIRLTVRELGHSEIPPMVFQYNKRDLPGAVPEEELERVLNPTGQPAFSSVAYRREGVIEPLTALSERVVRTLA
ncbi:MAG: gliding-motility protein MglA [marine benthic group bacterium]|nr:gliding-motility protein MglA [Gemmatimonadota bacterium]MCL7974092.1 gliding-motility protein MglA [Gemmatimonadota bacterium]MCL7983995.1 gliding-motility protein MglA [Gemmatimonadota bacterium]